MTRQHAATPSTGETPTEGAPTSAVLMAGVSQRYGEGDVAVQALHPTDLEIPSGELVVVLGPSRSGKTTLLNLIGGIEQPTSGRLEVAGKG